ncbi:hypothetical protein E2C01_045394 [Portunus trituberculatus]|uniref:Uncharacterized protein n=1 Tax=Portunus trituberculatus TaxID=210409 RepID=A0A5B7G149_PORTR|nr:hypothetical protein [Portunus trituberculatus]
MPVRGYWRVGMVIDVTANSYTREALQYTNCPEKNTEINKLWASQSASHSITHTASQLASPTYLNPLSARSTRPTLVSP